MVRANMSKTKRRWISGRLLHCSFTLQSFPLAKRREISTRLRRSSHNGLLPIMRESRAKGKGSAGREHRISRHPPHCCFSSTVHADMVKKSSWPRRRPHYACSGTSRFCSHNSSRSRDKRLYIETRYQRLPLGSCVFCVRVKPPLVFS